MKHRGARGGVLVRTSGLFLGILLILYAPFIAFSEENIVYTLRSVSFKITGSRESAYCAKKPTLQPELNSPR